MIKIVYNKRIKTTPNKANKKNLLLILLKDMLTF